MTGFWLSLNTVTAVLPGILKDPIGLSPTQASFALMVAAAVNAGGSSRSAIWHSASAASHS